MVEEMKEGAATLESNQTILYANRRLAELLGESPERLRGSVFREFVAREALTDWESLLAGSHAGRGEILLRKDGGSTFPAQVAVAAFQEDQVSAFCIVITDLTEQKTHAAAAAAEEAWREADRRKNEFLATLGHELRNPLAAIANSIEILEQLGPPEPRLQRARAVIRRQVQHVGRMVDDLLDVSRIETGKIELRREAVDICRLVSRVAEAHRRMFEERRRALTLSIPSEPLLVHADPTRLAQVVANLLDNALKFTDEDGLVRVTLAPQAGEAVLTVRDTGIGISPETLPRIFDLFSQGDRLRAATQTGLGIGLALVRRLVEVQGGTIAARSDGAGLGSEFEVRLPSREAPQDAVPAADRTVGPADARPQRILIVEDHVDSADGLATLLRLRGHEVMAVYDGPSALSGAGEFQPETVLLDIGLPGMDGYEVGRRLRDTLGDGVLIVALTGYGQDEDRRRSAEARIDHHVLKPVRSDVLEELLNRRSR
jgi:PAS domain S-box-containing protein